VWLDVEEFEVATARATAAARKSAEPQGSEVRAQDDLEIAVELHQGEYLSDWLYEDWAHDERERLEARYMEAATLFAQSLVARNELSEAIRLCELVLARDPAWEDAYCVLMRAYALGGQRRLALSTYERCVRNLREYLDVGPLPGTTRIYEQVKMSSEYQVPTVE
jgi:DNA-binding SARP family transcriptional activator